jgi:hypothetical protein
MDVISPTNRVTLRVGVVRTRSISGQTRTCVSATLLAGLPSLSAVTSRRALPNIAMSEV